MDFLSFSKQPVSAECCAASPGGETALRTDAQGRPVLYVGAAQTVAASGLDIRDLSAARDTAAITASDFDIRALTGGRDSVLASSNGYFVTSGSASILIGGTVVLTVDTRPYGRSAFLVRVDFLALGTTVSLQLAPVNTSSYFETVSSQTGLALGGTYLFVPSVPMRYARIYATGATAQLTAYYVGQI